MLTPGTIIDGRYRIDREVGSGGFATVFAAQHLSLDAPVAVKVLRLFPEDSAARRKALLESFLDEAKMVTRLRHDNVVRTLDQGVHRPSGSDFGLPYVVLEWCGDASLASFLGARHGRALDLSEALELFDALASGVAHAHQHGIAHRDLKPANVMLAHDARGRPVPRIIDFGIGKLFEVDRDAGGTMSMTSSASKYTPAYAAPEQLGRLATGPWTDVHALGLIFVELVSGRPPYERSALGAIDPNRPTPKSFGVDVGAIEPVIARAVALDPRDRFRDAGELLSALRAAQRSAIVSHADTVAAPAETFAPTGRTPLSSVPASPSVSRRRSAAGVWTLGVLGVAALGLTAAVGVGVWVLPRLGAGRGEVAPRPSVSAKAEPGPMPLSRLTIADLEQRLLAEGARITGRGEEGAMQYLHFTGSDVAGTAYLNTIPAGPGSAGGSPELGALPSIKSWIIFDRAQGLELAYGVEGDRVLSLTGRVKEPTLALFETLAKGVSLRIRGSSFGPPDPATRAEDARPLWRAKSLAELELSELMSRIATADATIEGVRSSPDHWTVSIASAAGKGQIDVFRTAAADSTTLTRDLQTRRVPFVRATGGHARVVSQGPGSLGSKKFLLHVLDGLSVSVE